MQTVLEQGSIDKPLTFDVGLIQLSFIPVCSLNTCNISVKLCRGFAALQCFFENSNNQLKYEVIRSEKGTITTLEIFFEGHSADTISGSFKSSHFFFFFIIAHLIRP